MNIATVLENAARPYGAEPAISVADTVLLSYAAFRAEAAALGAGLMAKGLTSGDRVALAMSNCPHYYVVMFGCWMAGLTVAPMNPRLHMKEFAFAVEDSGAALCFATPELAGSLSETLGDAPEVIDVESATYDALLATAPLAGPVRVAPDDIAWLFYTSGTTGRPKGAMLTHRNLMAMTVSFLADSGACRTDNVAHIAPLSHASGMVGLSYIARGRNNVILPGPDKAGLEAALKRFAPLSCFAVPTVVRRFCDPAHLDPALADRFGKLFFGGAPMYVEDLKRAASLFGPDRLWQLYGQGEAPCTITYLPAAEIGRALESGDAGRLGSVGIARSGVSVRIVDEGGAPLPPGEIGEVAVAGDVVMAGYWGRPEATAAAIRDGWLHTGDLGAMDAEGYLTLVDRSKDMIISGGSNIYPREIEEVLLLHEGLTECSVIGVEHEEWGEVPVAFIVGNAAAGDLDSLCLDHLARYKRPRTYIRIDELPKSSYGKILKSALREKWAADNAAALGDA